MIPLRQSTAAQHVLIGPFVDATDGFTPETGLSIAASDIRIWKANGGPAEVAKNSGGAVAHVLGGRYYCTLDATDTSVVGPTELNINMSGARPVKVPCYVFEEAVYDALYAAGATGRLPANVQQWNGANVATPTVAGVPEVDITHIAGSANTVTLAQIVQKLYSVARVLAQGDVFGIGDDADTIAEIESAGGDYDPATMSLAEIRALLETVESQTDDIGAAGAGLTAVPDSAGVGTLLARLTAIRAGYLDKLNVSGTLAHSDAANTYKADVSALLTSAAFTAALPANFGSLAIDGSGRITVGSMLAAVIEAIAVEVDARLLDAGDATDLIASIVTRIGNTNVDQAALVSAIRAALFDAGSAANKLSVDASGRVTVGSNADKTGYSLAADQAVNVTKVAGVSVSGVNDFKATGFATPTDVTDARDAVIGALPSEPPTAAENATELLNRATSGHTTAGTVGKAIADAATASASAATNASTAASNASTAATNASNAATAATTAATAAGNAATAAGEAKTAAEALVEPLDDLHQTLEEPGVFSEPALANAPTGGGGEELTGPNVLTVSVMNSVGGAAVEGAIIRVSKDGVGQSKRSLGTGQQTWTVEDGTTWQISVWHPKFHGQTRTGITISGGTASQAFQLVPLAIQAPASPELCTLVIRTLDETNVPASGKVVKIINRQGAGDPGISPDSSPWTVVSDEDALAIFGPTDADPTERGAIRGGKIWIQRGNSVANRVPFDVPLDQDVVYLDEVVGNEDGCP